MNLEAKSEFKRVCASSNAILWRLSDPKILLGHGCGLQRQQLRIFKSKPFKEYAGHIAICQVSISNLSTGSKVLRPT